MLEAISHNVKQSAKKMKKFLNQEITGDSKLVRLSYMTTKKKGNRRQLKEIFF